MKNDQSNTDQINKLTKQVEDQRVVIGKLLNRITHIERQISKNRELAGKNRKDINNIIHKQQK